MRKQKRFCNDMTRQYEGLAAGVKLSDYPCRAFCRSAHEQIVEFLDFVRERYGRQRACVYTDEQGQVRTVSYVELVADVERVAASWWQRFDPVRPQKVSVRLEPGYWWLVSILALWRLRQTVCLWQRETDGQAQTVIKKPPSLSSSLEAKGGLADIRPEGDDLALLIATSGTTGRPKLVALTQKNILAVIWGGQFLHDFRGDRAVFGWLPGEHILGLSVLLWWCSCGSEIYFPLDWRRPESLLPLARPTVMVVPTLMLERLTKRLLGERGETADALVARTAVERFFGGALTRLICGGQRLDVSVQRAWARAGVEVLVTYGCTECAPGIASGYRGLGPTASVGRPLANIEVKMVGGPGPEEGEIWVRGPQVMQGYDGDETRTAAVLTDGWYRTGDWGRRGADGLLYVTGRMEES